MRVGSDLLVVSLFGWFIGAIAAGQRHYCSGCDTNCAKTGTIAVTIIAGPLSYVGVNPKVSCATPQPSK